MSGKNIIPYHYTAPKIFLCMVFSAWGMPIPITRKILEAYFYDWCWVSLHKCVYFEGRIEDNMLPFTLEWLPFDGYSFGAIYHRSVLYSDKRAVNS